MDDFTGEWFTYRQAAEMLNLSTGAVRQRARRAHWQRTLGNDKRARVRLPEDWKVFVRPAGDRPNKPRRLREHVPAKRVIEALRSHVETLKSNIDTLKSHVEVLQAQLGAAEARVDKQAADFALREARLTADLSVEHTLAEQMSVRVDQIKVDLAVEQARRIKLEHELEYELARRWWRPRT